MSHHRRTISAPDAPAAVAAYSHAVQAGGLVFCSGQIPVDPATGELVDGGPGEQLRQCLANLGAVARAAGCDLARDAVRIGIFLTDMDAFGEVNAVYVETFSEDPPARAAVGVAALPKGAQVEVDAVLAIPG